MSDKHPQHAQPDSTNRRRKLSEEEIDYNIMGSFPASDPPSWTLGLARNKQPSDKFDGDQASSPEPSHQNQDS